MANSYEAYQAEFNIRMSIDNPNWYELLPQVEAAMAAADQEWKLAKEAGWDADEGGLISPWGHSEYDWSKADLPLPFEKDYNDFIENFKDQMSEDCDLDLISEAYHKYYFNK
jgi:hypothetical protein